MSFCVRGWVLGSMRDGDTNKNDWLVDAEGVT